MAAAAAASVPFLAPAGGAAQRASARPQSENIVNGQYHSFPHSDNHDMDVNMAVRGYDPTICNQAPALITTHSRFVQTGGRNQPYGSMMILEAVKHGWCDANPDESDEWFGSLRNASHVPRPCAPAPIQTNLANHMGEGFWEDFNDHLKSAAAGSYWDDE